MSGGFSVVRRWLAVVLGAALLVALAMPAAAQHRARLSKDLSDQLGSPTRAALQVIVQGDSARAQQLAARFGLRVKKVLESGTVLEGSAGQIEAAAADPEVAHLSLDAEVTGQMAVTREAIGASLVYGKFVRQSGYTGKNVTIAVIDSGVDANYPGLQDRLVYSKDFTGTGLDDQFGHGTHIVDLIAGAEHGGNFGGVAPEARIVSLKVLEADGSGQTSDVLAALDWVRQNRDRYQIRVVNLSLGHPVFESYEDDPLAQAVQRLIDDGVVVVASAGNYGKVKVDGVDVPVFGGISSPGNLPDVITVGALNTFGTVDRGDDSVATYSSKGPSAFDKVLKPDLVAPGNKIWAYMAAGTTVPGGIPEQYLSTAPDGSPLIAMSGTSESAGVVAGVVALMLEANPSLRHAHVKMALQLSAQFLPEGVLVGGSGSLNAAGAVWMAKNGPSPKVPTALIG
ncbi:MAG: S8 family peptidase, partial [Gemmatimonadales bacterium]|nr:S8 family peptidase [Gemmatimonadales bacterium]